MHSLILSIIFIDAVIDMNKSSAASTNFHVYYKGMFGTVEWNAENEIENHFQRLYTERNGNKGLLFHSLSLVSILQK